MSRTGTDAAGLWSDLTIASGGGIVASPARPRATTVTASSVDGRPRAGVAQRPQPSSTGASVGRARRARHGGRLVAIDDDGAIATFDAASAGRRRGRRACSSSVVADHRSRRCASASPPATSRGRTSDCSGLPVVVAARLQDEAGDGEILVSHVVRLLAGDRARRAVRAVRGASARGRPRADRGVRGRAGDRGDATPTAAPDRPPPLPLAWRAPRRPRPRRTDDARWPPWSGRGRWPRRRGRPDRAARR